MTNRWTSRKFWLTVIAAVGTLIATLGFDVGTLPVVAADALVAVWVLVEGIIDMTNKK